MRCNDCNRFVSQELDDIETSVDLDEQSQVVNVSFTLSLLCGECSSTLATAEEEGTFDFPPDLITHLGAAVEDGTEEEHQLTCDDGEVEGGDYYENKTRTIKTGPNAGKVVGTPFRYQKHFYTANWSSTINCSCGETFDISGQVEAQASEFQQY